MSKGVVVIIAALNPDQRLLDLSRQLHEMGFDRFIVVNDGSSPSADQVFNKIAGDPGVTVLNHAVNCGKGRALKTAFNYFLARYQDYHGVVTVDADGQHAAEDIKKVAEVLLTTQHSLVLGTRSFSKQVPFRSRIGNVFTKYVFRYILGTKVSDTQTGLRGIHASLLASFLKLSGERYEYEANMLIYACRSSKRILEVPIKAIYLDGNRSSHFEPFRDSLRIYFVFFRFAIASAFTSLIDLAAFTMYIALADSLPQAIVAGRSCSVAVNFFLNKKFVFKSEKKLFSSLISYLALVALLAFVSFLMIDYLHKHFGIAVVVSKLISETILFIFSFSIQNNFIFINSNRAGEKN